MRYWKYKAYDASGDRVDGVIAGDQPLQLVLNLRQLGLQVYDLVTIQRHEYQSTKQVESRLARLLRLRASVATRASERTTTKPTNITGQQRWRWRRAANQRRTQYYSVVVGCVFALILAVVLILIST